MEENDKEGQAGCHSVVGKEKQAPIQSVVTMTTHPVLQMMTITHEKKDEVSLLSGPSRSAFVLLEDSVFNKGAEPCGQVVMEAADEGNEQKFWTTCETQITCSQ